MDLHLANRVSAEAKRSQQLSGMGGGKQLTGAMQQTGAEIIWKQLSSLQRLNKHARLPPPLRCQICLAVKVLRLEPTMQVDSIETPQTEAPHEQPHVPCLSSFVITLNQDVWLHLNKLVLLGQNQTPAEIIPIFPSHLLWGTQSRFYTGSSAKNTTKITNSLTI